MRDSRTVDYCGAFIRNAKRGVDVNNLNESGSGAAMLASPVSIYLGCAGLIVGSLGLGAQYVLSGNSVSATKAEAEQPLFARSVEEASLPASNWSSPQPHVAYYDPMMKLRTTPSRSVTPTPATESPQANAPEAAPASAPHHAAPAQTESAPPQAAPPREVVRDIPQQTRRRNRNAHGRENAATEQVDPQDAYGKVDRDPRSRDRQRNTTQVDNDRPNAGPRRSERRYGSRDDDAESVDTRFRPDRRRVDVDDDRPRRGERRVIVQDEPEPRIVRGPGARDGGFSPFRLFGIFER